jgi:hypothetical protein
MRSTIRALWLIPAILWMSIAAAQTGVPTSACQGDPNSLALPQGEVVTPAYYFPSLAATSERPELPVAFSVWRAPCAQDGTAVLWVRMIANPLVSAMRPRVTVVQDGVEKGWFGVQYSGTNSFNTGGQGFSWHRQLFDVGNLGGAQTGILHALVPFDPDRAFTFRVRYTNPQGIHGWTASTPDVVYEIPARGTPGNVASVPDKLAGLWWNPAEPGTALILDRNQRGVTFAAWLTYNDKGDTTWFVMTNSTPSSEGGVTGAAYSLSGQPFARFDYQAVLTATEVGQFGLRFSDVNNGEFSYRVNGRSGRMPIQRLEIRTATGAPCMADRSVRGVDNLAGWAVSLEGSSAQGCGIHASLLTYDPDGSPMWVFSGLSRTTELPQLNVPVAGDIYRPKGTPYGLAYDPARLALGEPLGRWAWSQTMQLDIIGAPRAITTRRFFFEY